MNEPIMIHGGRMVKGVLRLKGIKLSKNNVEEDYNGHAHKYNNRTGARSTTKVEI